jgi:hypothetical protein
MSSYGTIVRPVMSSLLDLSLLLICYLLILVDYCLLKIGEMRLKCCQNFIKFINFDNRMSIFLKILF